MSADLEHAFASYLRILGRGKHTARSLTREEAHAAFSHILKHEVLDIQLGAFLMLLRVKGEDANEMAGFAEAARDIIAAPPLDVHIDWPSYAGKNKQQPWYLLAALLLASHGHRIVMHSSSFATPGRMAAAHFLPALGVEPSHHWLDIEQHLATRQFAFVSLGTLCPSLNQLFSYRSVLGVRSPVNSLVKLVNPFQATTGLQSVFHPAYLEIHQQAAQLLGQRHNLVLKGEGGEIEFRPDADNRLFLLREGECCIDKWPRTQPHRQPDLNSSTLSASVLQDFWAGELADDYALNAVLGTTAMVLFACASAANAQDAWSKARDYWHYRDKHYVARSLVS
jgi:anthranilate phosphoribosyltransferase